MKADWDKLGKKYANSDSVIIVDVDCTAGGQSTCQQQGVKGYPTIKYYMAGKKNGQPYQQGRDYNSLDSFVQKTLQTVAKKCNPVTGADCKDIEKRFIAANKDKSADEIRSLLEEKKLAAKNLKKEKRDYETEYKTKQKEFKKSGKKLEMATNILNGMLKAK